MPSSGPSIPLILGTYASPKSFWEAGHRFDDYGVNAVFTGGGSIDEALFERAKSEGCLVFAEYATLNGGYADYVTKHPDAHPIDDAGNKAAKATWFMGVCPTHAGFREYRMDALRRQLERFELDGVWMDYLHWHAQFEDPYPIFIKTCFCDSCLSTFQSSAGISIEGGTVPEKSKWIFENVASAWEDWRVSVVVDWAIEIRGIVKAMRPNALVGAFHCAWKDADLGGVRRRCLGLDFAALAPHVDVFSPMVYHGRSGKAPEYVRDFVTWMSDTLPIQTEPGRYPRVWPIVQAFDEPRVTPEEFEKVLRYGLGAKSTGVMMFTLPSVVEDEGKMAVMKRVYEEMGKGG